MGPGRPGRFSHLVSRHFYLNLPVEHFMSFINLFQIHDRSRKNNCRYQKIHQTSFFIQNSHFSSDSSFHPILNSLKFIRFCSFSNTIYISFCISVLNGLDGPTVFRQKGMRLFKTVVWSIFMVSTLRHWSVYLLPPEAKSKLYELL